MFEPVTCIRHSIIGIQTSALMFECRSNIGRLQTSAANLRIGIADELVRLFAPLIWVSCANEKSPKSGSNAIFPNLFWSEHFFVCIKYFAHHPRTTKLFTVKAFSVLHYNFKVIFFKSLVNLMTHCYCLGTDVTNSPRFWVSDFLFKELVFEDLRHYIPGQLVFSKRLRVRFLIFISDTSDVHV